MAIDFDALVLGPCMDAFGQSVTYVTARAQRIAIAGVFDRYNVQVDFDPDKGVPVSTYRTILGIRASDLAAAGVVASQGDTVLIGADSYEITDVQPDGHGQVTLVLMRRGAA